MSYMLKLDRPPRPAHNRFGACQLVYYIGSKTVGEVTSWLVANHTSPYSGDDNRKAIEAMVEEYFATNPTGIVVLGNYTPRARKRRGLRTKQRRLFCIKLGNERHYLPGVTYYANRDVTVRANRITVRCRCKGVNRAHVPVITELWAPAS